MEVERCAQIRLVGVHTSTCDGQREVFTPPLWNKATKERMLLHSKSGYDSHGSDHWV